MRSSQARALAVLGSPWTGMALIVAVTVSAVGLASAVRFQAPPEPPPPPAGAKAMLDQARTRLDAAEAELAQFGQDQIRGDFAAVQEVLQRPAEAQGPLRDLLRRQAEVDAADVALAELAQRAKALDDDLARDSPNLILPGELLASSPGAWEIRTRIVSLRLELSALKNHRPDDADRARAIEAELAAANELLREQFLAYRARLGQEMLALAERLRCAERQLGRERARAEDISAKALRYQLLLSSRDTAMSAWEACRQAVSAWQPQSPPPPAWAGWAGPTGRLLINLLIAFGASTAAGLAFVLLSRRLGTGHR